ncbi:hypothetical protein SMICM17S_11969 [Streptomyces microflavus]
MRCRKRPPTMETRRPVRGDGVPGADPRRWSPRADLRRRRNLAGRSVRRRYAVVLRPPDRGRPPRREPRRSGRARRAPPLHLRQPGPRTAQRPPRRLPPGPYLLRGAARTPRSGGRPAWRPARRGAPRADDQRPDLGRGLRRPAVLARHLPPAGHRRGRLRADGDRRRDQRHRPAAGRAGGGAWPCGTALHRRRPDRHHARHGHHLPGARRLRRARLRRRGSRRRLPAPGGPPRTPCRPRCPAAAAVRAAGRGAARRAGAAVRTPGSTSTSRRTPR